MHRGGVAVIGVIGGDHPGFTRQGLRHAQSHVICLGSGAAHQRGVKAGAKGGGQRLDIIQNAFVHIAGMGVQRGGLLGDGLHHLGVAMAHMRHVIVAIKVFAPLGIPQPHALPPHQMHGIFVEGRHIRPQQAGAAGL